MKTNYRIFSTLLVLSLIAISFISATTSYLSPSLLGNHPTLFYNSKIGNGTYQIWMLKNGKEKQLTNDNRHDYWWARVSPDKRKFLCYRSPKGDFQHDNDYKRAELWVFDIDGRNGKKIIDLKDYNWRAQGVADWSPDGKKLLMAATIKDKNDKNQKRWHLMVTDANGKNPIQISKRSSLYLDPSWSPDGKKITYSAFPKGFKRIDLLLVNTEIHVATLGKDYKIVSEKRLTRDKNRDHDPYFSPDGQYIAFQSVMKFQPLKKLLGEVAIRKVRADGSGKTEMVLNDGNVNAVASWTADSKSVYFHRIDYRKRTPFHIARVDADGSNFTTVLLDKKRSIINPHVVY